MLPPSWGDVLQAVITILVAAIFGSWFTRRFQKRDFFDARLEGELSRILDFAQATESLVTKIYDTMPSRDAYDDIKNLIYDVDSFKRTSDVIHRVMTPKMNDLQLQQYTIFNDAFSDVFRIVRSLDSYFDENGPLPNIDARVDLKEPTHCMFESLTRIIVRI